MCLSANALTITQTQGWFESGCVKWAPVTGATDYNVYVSPSTNESWTKLDKELVRQYPSYYRADAVGLKAGDYKFKIEAVNGSSVMSGETATSTTFKATAHDRSGFAHVGMPGGVGAYKNDGTLKDGAKVLYVWADNAKTVTATMEVGSGKTEVCTGLQAILAKLEKEVANRTPMAVRIIGTIKKDDLDAVGSSAEGLQVKGKGSSYTQNITIEGIGDDAAIHSFGILCRNICGAEFRNFAVMYCMDDCLSLDTDNAHIWIHNMDFFYGKPGSDKDQAKGDGTIDLKAKTKNVTISYNHFYDSGKCSLGGMSGEISSTMHTYHHNWFDHSDSRHPRIRTQFFHIYNNYYDGVSKYGVGVTSGNKTDKDNNIGGSAFVEANYFRNTKYPFLISRQGTDAEGKGTFSGEDSGIIKAYNNTIVNAKQVKYNTGSMTTYNWDAVLVADRAAVVTAKSFSGYEYNNAADEAARTTYIENKMDAPESVPAIVTGELGAGRMNHGDFVWEFDNSKQDENYDVIGDLSTSIQKHQSTLVGFADGTKISNGGAAQTFVGGDGVGISDDVNDSVLPSWGTGKIITDVEGGTTPDPDDTGDDSEDAAFDEVPYIASADGTDFFWFGENADQTNVWLTDGTITVTTGTGVNKDGNVPKSSFQPTYAGNDTYKAEHIGSLQLGQATTAGDLDGGYCTIYCPQGITTFKINTLRTGDTYYTVQKSEDGINFTTVSTITKEAKGIVEKDFSTALRDLEGNPVWVRIINGSTGGLNIHGVRICQPLIESDDLQAADLTKVNETTIALNLVGENTTYTLAKNADYTTSSTGEITYASSNAKVATVSAEGVITAVGAGSANITLTQAADDTYKTGKITFAVTVTDNRAASALALTSEAEVTISMDDEDKTSQIAVTGAAGSVTYSSDKTSIATVSAEGVITAVAAGTAVITITDAGNATTKPGKLTVTVTVEASEQGGGDEGDIEDDPTSAESVICHFTGKQISSDMVKLVSGDYSDSKGTVTYDGTEYKYCIKMESKTNITITPSFDCMVTLIFDATDTKLNLDGKSYSTDANNEYSFDGTAGTSYTLKKGGIMNLYLVVFTPKSSESESLQGDVDGNGKVEQADAELLVKILLEQEKATEGANVDESEDKDINVADLTKLIEILKKEEVTFPIPDEGDDDVVLD